MRWLPSNIAVWLPAYKESGGGGVEKGSKRKPVYNLSVPYLRDQIFKGFHDGRGLGLLAIGKDARHYDDH